MKTSLEIINKLSEKEAVKLESQLVELVNINQFAQATTKLDTFLKDFNKSYGDLEKLVPSVTKTGDLYLKSLDDTMDLSNEIFSKFKELGLNWTETPEYKNFKNVISRGNRGVVQTMVARVKNI
jgi:hypothetical protein